MKNLIVLSALVFCASQLLPDSAEAGAVRLLQIIPACKGFETVKRVNDADNLASTAMKKGDSALTNIQSFDNTCSQTAANSTYNSDTQINKLVSDSKLATQTAASAVTALDAAIKQATPIANSLGAVGAPKDCVNEAKALPGKLAAQKGKVESAMKKLESCVGRASVSTVTGRSTSTQTTTASSVSGKNPADHSDTPSSCMPGDGDCQDRGNLFGQ